MPLVRRTLALWTLIALATVSARPRPESGRRHGRPVTAGIPGPGGPRRRLRAGLLHRVVEP